MKTIKDLQSMKYQSGRPFENAYECFIATLEDYYIAKLDGKERIKNELKEWDGEAQGYIIFILMERIGERIVDFDANDLIELIK